MNEVLPETSFPPMPIFALCDEVRHPNLGGRERNLLSLSYGNIVRKDIESADGLLPASFDGYNVVEAGDTVLRLTDLQNDQRSLRTGLVQERGIITSAYLTLRPREGTDARFLAYSLHALDVTKVFYGLGGGMRQSMGFDDLKRLGVPLPPLAEQARIARFLDDQTTRIDRIIAARQQQRALLDEEFRASVWESVTGHRTSGARERSGLGWAPDLPVGWGSPRVCQVARMGTGHTPSRSNPGYWVECDIPWLTTADVHRFRHDQTDVLTETAFQISQVGLENSSAVLHASGTVALSRTASAGFSVVMGADMATSQDYATWTCGPRLNNMFLLWCLRAMRQDIMGRLAIGSTHKTIYFPDLMSIRVPLPPLDYQMDAIVHIQQEADAFRTAERGLANSVDLLNEFKRSLISAAVSGDFDVSVASGRGVPA